MSCKGSPINHSVCCCLDGMFCSGKTNTGSSTIVMGKGEAVGPQRADRGLAVGCRLSPHPGLLPRGEEGVLRPAWNSKAALTHPAAGLLAKRGACLPPRGPRRGQAVYHGICSWHYSVLGSVYDMIHGLTPLKAISSASSIAIRPDNQTAKPRRAAATKITMTWCHINVQ